MSEAHPSLRVARVYLRVSTDAQDLERQENIIEAAKASTYKTSSASGAKKTASKKTSAELKLTAGEKKLVELYREADSDTRKKAVSVLKGEQTGVAGLIGGILGELDGVDLGGIADMLGKKQGT